MKREWEQVAVRRTVRARRALAAVMLGGVLWSMATSPAIASDTSVTVSPGSLGVTSPAVNDFTIVVLDGTVQVAHSPLEPFSVTDARGSGGGWTVSLQATPFREWDRNSYVPDGKTLSAGSLSLAGVAVTADGTGSELPAIATGPFTLDGPAVTVATAPPGGGMGTFVFDPTGSLAVTVPASAYARTYRSELAISVTSGP